MTRRLLVGGALLAALLPAAPSAAQAHAMLQSSSPARGATVAHAPAEDVFRFDESVEATFGAVRVFDGRGGRVDRGDAFHPGGRGSELAVHLKPGLPDGTYTATYRIVSADSHVVSSGVVFSIGTASAAGTTVEELLGTSGAGRVTGVALAVARAVQYVAMAIAGGVVAFLLVVWSAIARDLVGSSAPWRRASQALVARTRTMLFAAALAGATSALVAVVLQTAEGAGVNAWSALDPSLLSEVLGTRFGTVWAVGAGCWLAIGVLAALPRASAWVPVAPLSFIMLIPALSGHGTTQHPVALLLPANVLHVVAMATWVGGLATLLLALPAATRCLDPGLRTTLLATTLRRFSTVALGAVVVLLITGIVQSLVEVRRLDLVLSTPFGRAVAIKLGLVLALIGFGALNRRRSIPWLQRAAREQRSPGADGVLLRRTLRAELLLMAAALGVTGALAGYAPSIAASTGPFSATTRLGPQELQLTLDPARVGANQVHVYLTDPVTGAQLDDAEEVTITAALPAKGIGALDGDARKAGPGHYVVTALRLAVAGTWQLTVTARVSEFDEYTTQLAVRIR